MQVALLLLVLPAVAVLLAAAKKGTLGLWVFAMGTAFTSYWAGLGWLPAELDWRFILAFAVLGALCGLAAGTILSRVSRPQERTNSTLSWAVVGAGSAAIGMLASWPFVQSIILRMGQPNAGESTPFSVHPEVMSSILLTVVVVWFALSFLVALATGYIKLARGLPRQSAAPEQL
jgi:hypothetical protein